MDQNNEEIAVINSSPPMVPVAIPASTKPKESHSHPSCLRPCFWLQHHHAASATLVGCSLVAVRLARARRLDISAHLGNLRGASFLRLFDYWLRRVIIEQA